MSFLRSLLGALAVLCLFCLGALAQSDTAQILGTVKDPSGAIVANANVSVRNEATGLERRVTTNEAGVFVAVSLPPGYYTVTVEATGFKKFVTTNNKLDPNVAATVNATLEVGAVAETVEVTASVAVVQSETATVGKLVEGRQIKDLMLNGRNPLFLALLKPGVRGGALSGLSFGLSSGGFSINGSRTQDLLITFDGAIGIRTRANGTSIGTADLETVQEVQILTANYAAEYGRSAGGQIRMVTKSGSHGFHGSAYEYFRNNVLDANSWTRNRSGQPRETQRYNQFGFIASGPVYIPGKWNTDRNKLFFLWGEEWLRRRRESTTFQTVPTMLMRGGNFSELLDPNNRYITRTPRVPVTINDPLTGAPFTGNIIPANRLSPNGRGFLNAYPEPNGLYTGSSNFTQTRPQPENQRKDTFSFDFVPTEKHTLRLRHQRYEWTSVDAFRTGFDRAVTDWSRPNRNVSLNHIWTISPTFINEALMTASVDRVYIGVYRPGERFARSKYGINYPYIFPERKEIFDKIPTIEIPNFGTVDGGPYPAFSSGPVYVLYNNTSKIVGNHTLKWGIAFERLGQNDFDQINVSGVPGGTNNQNGRFVFTDGRAGGTGVAIGNAILGLFDTYAEIGPRAFTPYRSHTFEWFLQDSWKLTDKLKLEYGVRHTFMNPYYKSLWGNIAVFDPKRYDPSKAVVQDPRTGNVLSGDRYNGVLIPGSAFPEAARGRVAIADSGEFNRLFSGGSVYWGEAQKWNFQPRLGIAYSINPRTVLRAGGGRFMSRPGVSDNIFLGGNPPFQPMISIAAGQADNPGGGARTGFPQFFMTSDPVFKIPSAWNWTVGVQREIGWNTTVEVGYVGRTGLHLERERELNALRPGTLQANPTINVNALRPFKGFAFLPMGETASRSEYNGLQLEVNRRFTNRLSYGFAYTYSKSMDNASDRRARLYNPFDDRNYWGMSGFDTRHVAVFNWIYELPYLREQHGVLGKVAGGWQVTGVIQFQTGTPITIGRGVDYAGIGSGSEGQPWNVNGDAGLSRGERAFANCVGSICENNFWFRTTTPSGGAIFTQPAAGTYANQNRNSLPFAGPGFQNWNIAGFKEFLITEQHRVQFRAEFFNFPNHPNWGGASTDPASATFGKVTSKSSERNIQLSLRYNF